MSVYYTTECTVRVENKLHTLKVEYIVMEFYLDTEIHTFRSHKIKNCPLHQIFASRLTPTKR